MDLYNLLFSFLPIVWPFIRIASGFQVPLIPFPSFGDTQSNEPTKPKNPVVLIPGYMGSQLQMRLARKNVTQPYCPKTSEIVDTLWYSLRNFEPYYDDCWVENMRMHYNNRTRRSYSDHGVHAYPRDFGNTTGIEFVSPEPAPQTMYFYNLVQALVNKGYERDVTVLGAPYDFRRAPNENQDFMVNLKLLIERTVEANERRPAIVVCHSMGCMFSYYFFLREVDSKWKSDHVKAWVVAAAPLGGNFKYMYGYFADDDWPATMFRKIRIPERTFSSTAFLLPHSRSFANDILVQTSTRNYTINDFGDFFAAVGAPNAYEQWLDTKDLLDDFPRHPGMHVYCVGGVGVQSLENAIIEGELLSGRVVPIFGDGDGILNTKSMKTCLQLQSSVGSEGYRFEYQEFPLDHMEIIQHQTSVSYIVQTITQMA